MILWFGNKKKKDEALAAGEEIAKQLSAEDIAAQEAAEAEAKRLAEEEAARKAAEQIEIDRKVAEAAAAWEARQKREAADAEAEIARLAEEARKAEEAGRAADAEAARRSSSALRAAQEKAAAELKLLEERRDAERRREEASARKAQEEEAARIAEEERQAAIARGEPDPMAETKTPGFMGKLTGGLAKSSGKLGSSLSLFGKKKLDDDTLEELEDLLITSDLGASVAMRVTRALAKDRFDKEITEDEIRDALASEIAAIMAPREQVVDFSDGPSPRVVLFVGVNGSGKTTTIGKIASKLKEQGAKALLVAGDTFRAAAIEQLTVWGERAGIEVMSKQTGADAAGLVYEAIEKAKAENYDLVLVDTAGRLQNKAELMSELEKVVRVTKKLDPSAPHDVILVLDATVGQNALSQVEAFKQSAGVTGLVMTKLDGTAKGGVLVAVAEAHELPIHFIGVGEGADDLQPFSAEAFAKALVGV